MGARTWPAQTHRQETLPRAPNRGGMPKAGRGGQKKEIVTVRTNTSQPGYVCPSEMLHGIISQSPHEDSLKAGL